MPETTDTFLQFHVCSLKFLELHIVSSKGNFFINYKLKLFIGNIMKRHFNEGISTWIAHYPHIAHFEKSR